ncbi:hypothetical protein Q1695_015176 [Nippostrongylus brasiliensis]|nr:hypothetical protein Q1695_015176 [Nippostrongylus brasiliensis]
MRRLHLLVIPPPPWLIIICNIAAFLLVLVIFVIIIYIRTRPFCITPTEAELNCAKSLRSRRGSTGRVVSSTQASVKHGFSFKDHGDDIGTDMSDEEKESQLKPVDEASSAVPFDPKMVMMNMRYSAGQAEDPVPPVGAKTDAEQQPDLPSSKKSKKSEYEPTQRL